MRLVKLGLVSLAFYMQLAQISLIIWLAHLLYLWALRSVEQG
jgi:hypothetical protein